MYCQYMQERIGRGDIKEDAPGEWGNLYRG